MARSKHDEAFDRETEKMTKLGLENADHIKKAKGWCKHFRIEMVSAGLLAQMTGLPIGSHRISCQHASETHEAMNLPWIIPDFILKHCKGCQYHEANGNITWGKDIIEKFERQELERNRSEKDRKEKLSKLREYLRTLSHQAISSTKPTERKILSFIEIIFSEDEEESRKSSEQLVKSARIGADLFPSIAVEILVEQSQSDQFASQCLPVCIELSKQRPDLALVFLKLGFELIRSKRFVELASNILANCEKQLEFPLSTEIIENLITSQSHSRFMGSFYGTIREYPYSNILLIKSFDLNSNSITEPLKRLLNVEEKYQRINACGVIEELQDKRPELGIDLLPNLVSALELPDEAYEESADKRICQCIARTFLYSPKYVDEYLISQLLTRRVAVQEEIVSIYIDVISVPYGESTEHSSNEELLASEIAISRCINLIKENTFDLEVRIKAAEAIKEACTDRPTIAAKYFNNLLGYYLLICDQESPSLLPKIILPNQKKPSDPYLEQLDNYSHKQQWESFLSEITKSLKALASRIPEIIGLDVIKYYDSLDTKTNLTFKSFIVELLGEVGQNYSFQPQVLPYVMKTLMDFDSQVIRARGIRAVEKIYTSSKSAPPKNIIDVLVLHLRDTFVIVHKSAIQVLSRRSFWLNFNQTTEALGIISRWMESYKNKPYDLEDLCDAALNISSQYDDLNKILAQLVCHYLPTNEHYADERILSHLIGSIKPDSPIAEEIAKKLVWFLKNYPRDRYNYYGHSSRSHFLKWLYQLPHNTYLKTKTEIKDAALEIAKQDAWESCLFARLFVSHNDFDAEKEIITIAKNSLGDEKQYEKFHRELAAIQFSAEANTEKIRGNYIKANEIISQIMELGL